MDLKSTAALQSKAYDVLTKYFSDYEDEVLNIEILPPAFPPPDGICMQEDFNLGLPKEILALAFLEARRRFLANIQDGLLSIVSQGRSVSIYIHETADCRKAKTPSNKPHPPFRPGILDRRQLPQTPAPAPTTPRTPSHSHLFSFTFKRYPLYPRSNPRTHLRNLHPNLTPAPANQISYSLAPPLLARQTPLTLHSIGMRGPRLSTLGSKCGV